MQTAVDDVPIADLVVSSTGKDVVSLSPETNTLEQCVGQEDLTPCVASETSSPR